MSICAAFCRNAFRASEQPGQAARWASSAAPGNWPSAWSISSSLHFGHAFMAIVSSKADVVPGVAASAPWLPARSGSSQRSVHPIPARHSAGAQTATFPANQRCALAGATQTHAPTLPPRDLLAPTGLETRLRRAEAHGNQLGGDSRPASNSSGLPKRETSADRAGWKTSDKRVERHPASPPPRPRHWPARRKPPGRPCGECRATAARSPRDPGTAPASSYSCLSWRLNQVHFSEGFHSGQQLRCLRYDLCLLHLVRSQQRQETFVIGLEGVPKLLLEDMDLQEQFAHCGRIWLRGAKQSVERLLLGTDLLLQSARSRLQSFQELLKLSRLRIRETEELDHDHWAGRLRWLFRKSTDQGANRHCESHERLFHFLVSYAD